MSDEVKYSVKELKKAFKALQKASHMKRSDIVRDATIQRFEFTFELLWKTIRFVLEDKGAFVAGTPKEALQLAFKRGWIQNEKCFLDMLLARNKMSHMYDEQEAKDVYKDIVKRFLKPMQALITELDKQSND